MTIRRVLPAIAIESSYPHGNGPNSLLGTDLRTWAGIFLLAILSAWMFYCWLVLLCNHLPDRLTPLTGA